RRSPLSSLFPYTTLFRSRLMFVTILPNCLGPLIVQATLSFSSAILDAAALGFLGMGAQPPTPEWGTMLAEAQEFVLRAWWVVTLDRKSTRLNSSHVKISY